MAKIRPLVIPSQNLTFRVLLLALLCASSNSLAVVSRAEHLRQCIICHINWGDDFDRLEPFLPPLKNPVILDGEPARNSSEEMCWSCHDGYVKDSRTVFRPGDIHLRKLPKGFSTGSLPLDLNGDVYCGTCHTPHTHKMGRKYELSPFIRDGILASELCLNCHADHAGNAGNHPIHAQLKDGRGASLTNSFTPRDRVECLSCHKMHSAHPTRNTEGKDRGRLCAACHEPQQEVLSTRHSLSSGKPGEHDACSTCHAPHANASPDSRGNALCQRCHAAPQSHSEDAAHAWGHPLGAVPEGSGDLPLRQGHVACITCHDPHRWSVGGETDAGQPGTPGTSFLRRMDQAEEGLCLSCHPGQASILASDHGADEPLFISLSGQSVWRCSSCHDAHGRDVLATSPDGPAEAGLLSPATRLCLRCHEDAAANTPGLSSVGEFSHPVGRGIGALRPSWLPRLADERIGCETCHDPHQWSPVGAAWARGMNGDDASSFLRAGNHDGALCMDCHTNQGSILGSMHDRRGMPGESPNPCAACHSPHQAATPALLSSAVAGSNLGHLMPESDWAEGSRERQPDNWTTGAIGCLACHHDSGVGQRVPKAWFHPAWEKGPLPSIVPEERRYLHVDCRTCHNPHQPWREGREHGRVQFLTAESSETLCATCHGDEALWRFNYFHNPDRRRP